MPSRSERKTRGDSAWRMRSALFWMFLFVASNILAPTAHSLRSLHLLILIAVSSQSPCAFARLSEAGMRKHPPHTFNPHSFSLRLCSVDSVGTHPISAGG
eukprot:1794771-Rhodomonas_salina.1